MMNGGMLVFQVSRSSSDDGVVFMVVIDWTVRIHDAMGIRIADPPTIYVKVQAPE